MKESASYAHSSISIAYAAKLPEIPEATLRGWVKKAGLSGDVLSLSGGPIDVAKIIDELREF